MRIFLFSIVLLSLVYMPAVCSDGNFEFKFSENDKFSYLISVSTVNKIRSGKSFEAVFNGILNFTVVSVSKEGTAKLKSNLEIKKMIVKFDDNEQNLMDDSLPLKEKLLSNSFTMLITKKGILESIEGLEIVEEPMLSQFNISDTIKHIFESIGTIFSGSKTGVGDTWNSSQAVSIPSMDGQVTTKYYCKFEKKEKVGNYEAAVVKSAIKIEKTKIKSSENNIIITIEGKGENTTCFSLKEGKLISSESFVSSDMIFKDEISTPVNTNVETKVNISLQ